MFWTLELASHLEDAHLARNQGWTDWLQHPQRRTHWSDWKPAGTWWWRRPVEGLDDDLAWLSAREDFFFNEDEY